MAKSRRVPEVLQRAGGDRAHTLADAVVSILPRPLPPENCLCGGVGCLRCFDDADRFISILRPEDPAEYRQLLTRSCAVVSDKAPKLCAFDPSRRREQRCIVQDVIELMLCWSAKSHNMICAGYDKCHRTSHILDDLSSFPWSMLLTRIGDDVMLQLLKWSSIFLFLADKNLHQVTGYPLNQSLPNMKTSKYKRSGRQSMLQPRQLPVRMPYMQYDCEGPRKKRKLESKEKSTKDFVALGDTTSNLLHIKNCKEFLSCESHSKRNKHTRPFSWQRQRMRQNKIGDLSDGILERGSRVSGKQVLSSKGSVSKACPTPQIERLRKLSGFQSYKKESLPCLFGFLLQQIPSRGRKDTQIERQWMFYNSSPFSSLFPRYHILNRLKPNDSGAVSLMRNVFCLRDKGTGYPILNFIQTNSCCAIRSECLFHSLLDLLKTFIRRAQRCSYLKILDKHCSAPIMGTCNKTEDGNMSMEQNVQSKLSLFRVLTFHKRYTHLKSLGCHSFLSNSSNLDEDGHLLAAKAQIHSKQFEELKGSYCQYQEVVSFIWAICRSIIPVDLLGAPSNWRALRRNISNFIMLRRYEKFNLNQCKYGLKTSQVPFISKVRCTCCCGTHHVDEDARVTIRIKLFENWIFWFFSRLVAPLVVAHFYVTETEAGRHDVFYYRKQAWKQIMSKAIYHLRRTNHCLFDCTGLGLVLRKRSLGFSKVRFLPKEKGIRPLVNLKAPSCILLSGQKLILKRKFMKCDLFRNWEVFNFKPVNTNLRDLHAILKGVKVEKPDKLSSSVFDYDEIYRKLLPFITSLRGGFSTMPRIFVVVSDVGKAYDTINQDKLLNVMNGVLEKNEYCLQKFARVFCTNHAIRICYDQVSVEPRSSASIKSSGAVTSSISSHGILINQFRTKRLNKSSVLNLLREHVKGNLVQLGSRLYLQKGGISQGSILSSLLCSFYYAHMEQKNIFPWLQKIHELLPCASDNSSVHLPRYILLRFIDDFMFISTSKEQARHFLSRLQRGFREYNCNMNSTKFSNNFYVKNTLYGDGANRVYIGEDGVPFLPWSGLLVNCCTLEILADYTRYWGVHVSSTLTISSQAKSWSNLKSKLCDYMRPKCHPLFYDSSINCSRTVRLNAYQAFLLCAMKYHCYIRAMPNLCGPCPKYCFHIIQRSISYMYKLIKRRMQSMKLKFDLAPVLQLKWEEITWLGLSAYVQVLTKKQSKHRKLLKFLKAKLRKFGELENHHDLQYAVDGCHSSLLWKIKF